jgi:hypothetical protein
MVLRNRKLKKGKKIKIRVGQSEDIIGNTLKQETIAIS